MCRIITASELSNKTGNELSALFHKVSQQVASSEPDSPDRRNALASLENISRAMCSRLNTPSYSHPKPPFF